MFTQLTVGRLQIKSQIGWSRAERARKQALELDLWLRFPRPPKACRSDALADTVCYGEIADSIQDLCKQKSARLLEHLAVEIYDHLRSRLSRDAKVCIRLRKLKPPVPGLKGGAAFTYGDFQP